MGQTESSSNSFPGAIWVSVDRNYIVSGDVINGCVHINLSQILQQPQLFLIFKGRERVKFKSKKKFGLVKLPKRRREQLKALNMYYITHNGKHNLSNINAVLFK